MNIKLKEKRAKNIIRLRGKGYTYREIGKTFGLSKQRIHQIENWYEVMGKFGIVNKREKKPSLREIILLRDNNQCQFCFGKEKLNIHHIDRDRKNNSERNLITLCYNCHSMLHRQNKNK